MGRYLRALSVTALLMVSLLAAGQDRDMGANGQTRGDRKGNEQLQRDLWFHRGRMVKGKSAAELLLQARQQKLQLSKSKLSQQRVEKYIQSNLKWKNLGPAPIASDAEGNGLQDYGPVTGRATSVAVDQTDTTGNTVYVGGAYGGLWKSTNGAASDLKNVVWKQLLDGQASLAVGAVAVKPNDGNVLLVGTGEPNNAGDSYYGVGILRSADGGNTWTLIPSAKSADGSTTIAFKGLGFSRIVFSSDNPSLVLAAAAWTPENLGSFNPATDNVHRGVYYSTDAGATWTQAAFTNPDGSSVAHSAYGLAYNSATKHWFVSLGFRGFYTSTDGMNWTRLANQPGGSKLDFSVCPTSGSARCPVYRSEIAVRQNPNIAPKGELYAWYVDVNEVNQGVYVSTDDGTTWSAIDTTGMDACGDGSASDGCSTAQGSYNLTLAAVPNGGATDLIAGAVNLFKTSVTCTSDAGCAADGFKNLTHVYGCDAQTGTYATLAHVHPDQHGIDFSTSNPKIVYFANDGGIYRTLDDPNLNSGDCTVPNPFDNLNATMGSMTQIVGFSQTTSDTSILLAGSQDNGTETTNPVIDKGTGYGWTDYQGGDGGYNAINPANPDEWFASYPYGEITRCGGGVNCRGSFDDLFNYSTWAWGGDDTAFYMPFILDPQNTSQMIVGTCRVWRGDSNPTAPWPAPISYNFYTGDATACTSANSGMITALAAGGPKTDAGSEVIYTGDELGYLSATQTASAGPASWQDSSGTLDSNGVPAWGNYPVSSITLDPNDATGATTYITTQGFGYGHVWKTTDFGQTWTNITGDLPDAPADGFTIDPADHSTFYVGTDVGVFMSTNGGTNWTEYGPTSGAGSLPNVAITKLEAIAANGDHKLRVSTYGRGMWEIDLASYLDFTQTVTPGTAKVAGGGTTTYTVNFNALGNFASDVTVACANLPAGVTCTPNPATVGSTTNTSVVTVTTTPGTTPVGPNTFQITGTAGDLVKTSDVTLQVTDFGLATTQGTATVTAGNSATYPIQITSDSGHTDSVALTCTSTLPTGVLCGFTPAAVAPGGTATLTLSTTAATAMLEAPHFGRQGPLFAFWFGLPGIVVVGAGARGKRKKAIMLTLLVIVLVSMLAMAACGGGSSSSSGTSPSTATPAGSYTVTVTGTSGALTHTINMTLVVQ